MLDPNTIVICFGCKAQVRAKTTKMVPTGPDEDLERWCLDCLGEIDERTKFLMSDPSTRQLPGLDSLEDDIQRFLQDEEGK